MKRIIVTFLISLLPVVVFGQINSDQLFEDCNVSGSITIYHSEQNSWLFSDAADAQRETLPASTFKILNSAIALETETVGDEHEILEWDGTGKTFFGTPIGAWNADTDLTSAFKNSTIWFYEELAKRIGREQYRYYLDVSEFGNGDLSEAGNDFWNYGNFGVSPVNQIRFLKALYREELPSFSKSTYQTIKKLLVTETTDSYTLSGKTGWTKTGTEDIGWWVGYLERDHNTWFFATRVTKNISAENPEFSTCRMTITRDVLKQIGALE